MSAELLALLLIFAAHCVGVAALIGPLTRRAGTTNPETDGDDPPDGPDDGGLRRRHSTPRPRPSGGLPLPDAQPASRRLRGPGRLGDDQRPSRRRVAPPPRRVREVR